MAVKKKTLRKAKRPARAVKRAKTSPKARTTRGRRWIPPTFIELKMGGLLKRMGVGAIPQHRVRRKVRGSYYVDFAIPPLMLAIECDGKAYHSTPAQKRRDIKRQTELENLGWQVVRFTGSQIVTDISGCEQVLNLLLKRK